ncbi:MAG: chemotaxis protein CheB [Candidatus Thiodiazotropha sp.]
MSQTGTRVSSMHATSAFPVIGIGASAGGIEALRSLFGRMPDNIGAGFVLVLHLDPTHESLMAELLGRYTGIPVVQVENGMRVEPNRIHVIPPNSEMTIADGVLHLSKPQARRGMRTPIDRFFTSLAQDREAMGVAIVLSGTGTDGTLGVRMVKSSGGMVLVQDPATSAYDGMPRSAMATGDADFVLPVEEMPEVLRRYTEHLRTYGVSFPLDRQQQDVMDNILALLVARQDYDFRCYKRGTINRRVQRRMGLKHVDSLQAYHDLLRNDEGEIRALTKDLLIGVTRFFREPKAWDGLRDTVLKDLRTHLAGHELIRVWVPGCATGEEAYSLAMVLMEACETAGHEDNFMVFATDVDREALKVARTGVYPESLLADVDPDRLARFFVRVGDTYSASKRLREKIIFATHNLLADPPFSNLSLISCRNLLIYIQEEFQHRLMGLFHYSLRDGGFLFLGSSESAGGESRLFEPVSKRWRIYRRVDDTASTAFEFSAVQLRLPTLPTVHAGVGGQRNNSYVSLVHKALIDQFAPASVLVDRNFRVRYFHGAVSDYIGPVQGDPSDDLLMLAGEGIRNPLRSALQEAMETLNSQCPSRSYGDERSCSDRWGSGSQRGPMVPATGERYTAKRIRPAGNTHAGIVRRRVRKPDRSGATDHGRAG